MQKLLSLGLALCLSLTLSLDAEAKRFGGGKSWGKAPTSQPMRRTDNAAPSSAPAGAAAAAPARAAGAASGASRWLGPLAGIAAGGLLASMLFGDGFEGLQLMDILLFAGIAFLLFKLFASRRQAPSMAGAGQGMPQGMARQPASDALFGGSAAPQAAFNAPEWFDEARFVAAGREHFMSLQQHWDANEMDKVEEFVTPQLFAYLRDERAELGEGYQATYIDNLQAQLDDVQQQGDTTVASLTFIGVSKTSRFDQGEAFSETWRMEREGDSAPWLIAGIRQN
ncbi:Tim44 domain-containing protein [Atopomonas sediminilitoris]|uniref:Tim44 domain-containing protein n=1 Tax=Atopomonas sediminilitoris TaxID=2919919 RepID=UPI001F4ED4EE|nr:TIM44-like domain-containing protein [Atopomonas sediminilitoris]MCJ8168177.1 TIM44-like domain-containing protein [Atopomonas sediminilitoris]